MFTAGTAVHGISDQRDQYLPAHRGRTAPADRDCTVDISVGRTAVLINVGAVPGQRGY